MDPSARRPPWWRHRGYRHFGPLLDLPATEALVTDPEQVATHAFWPLLFTARVTRRYHFGHRRADRKIRPILIPAQVDASIFAYYATLLAEPYERSLDASGLGEVVAAYRSGQGSHLHHAAAAFAWVRSHAPCRVYCFDITQFFDQIDHARLKREWASLLGTERLSPDHFAVFRAMTRYASIKRDDLPPEMQGQKGPRRLCSAAQFRALRAAGTLVVEQHKAILGIPQGVPLSGLLANLYMQPFDRRIAQAIGALGGLYRRYSDDILIAVPTGDDAHPGDGQDIEALVSDALIERGLLLQRAKTTRHLALREADSGAVRIEPPLSYLGLIDDGRRVLLRGSTLARFHRRMLAATRHAARKAMENGGAHRMPQGALRRRFTHIGRKNFLSYVRRIAPVLAEHGLGDANSVRRQLRRSAARLERLMAGATAP